MRYPPPKDERRSAKGILSHPSLNPLVAYLPTRLWNQLSRLMRLFEENAMRRVREAEERVRQYAEAEARRITSVGQLTAYQQEDITSMSTVLTLEWRPEVLTYRMREDPRLAATLRPELRAEHLRRVVEEMARQLSAAIYADLSASLDRQTLNRRRP